MIKGNFSSNQQSILSYASSKGFICGIDLRTKNVKNSWQLENPAKFGLLECYMVDPQRNWIICGTDQGFYNLWDLRFQLLVRSWKDPRGTKINKLAYATHFGEEKIFSCVSEEEHASVTCWDIQNLECSQVLRANLKDNEDPELERKSLFLNPPVVSQFENSISEPLVEKNLKSQHSFRALLTDRSNYLLTAGTDKTIRFWDLKDTKNSKIISGPRKENKFPHYSLSKNNKEIEVWQENWMDEKEKINLTLNRNVDTHHNDCIMDIKHLEGLNMLVTCSRDSIIKVWK